MEDPTYLYGTPAAAAARWVRLYDERPGTVSGIDYRRLAMAICQTSHETSQDIALEKMQEFLDLTGVLLRAFGATRGELERVVRHVRAGSLRFLQRRVRWEVWAAQRIGGLTYNECAKHADCSKTTVQRYIGKVDTLVRDQLVERHLTVGYAGRDLAYIDEEPALPRVQVWRPE